MTTKSDPYRLRERIGRAPLHTCPACGAGFDVPDARLEPETGPWWRPKKLVHACPACQVRLYWVPNPQEARARAWLDWVALTTAAIGGGALGFVVMLLEPDAAWAWMLASAGLGLLGASAALMLAWRYRKRALAASAWP